ncbi:hypothetical protein HN832_04310 [archaeon]|jgi:hypothetical protein|nr:hypothetical protein [archaeon]MBT4373382.1 hypothetical protein [archaeon]MBT4531830.1 hypothetical protein [archaeon]MBT7001497.1 hypothetical protein [archaeon]MBT7282611.1 hypothetical protein [archaeon]
MFKTWRKRYRERNYFDISDQETVDSEALVKVLKGQVTNSNSKDSVYFIVCCNGLEMLQGDETIEVDDLKNVIEEVFNKSVWFGKFRVGEQSQIIVPNQYDLLVNPQKKGIYLQATERARYYNSGNLQLDKDLFTRILRTDIGLEKLQELVNSTCSGYRCGNSLETWKS